MLMVKASPVPISVKKGLSVKNANLAIFAYIHQLQRTLYPETALP
jgi:hypothetical protein